MQKTLPWLISAVLGATIASGMTWQASRNQSTSQEPKMLEQHISTNPLSFSAAIQKAAPAVVNFYSTKGVISEQDVSQLPGSSGLDFEADTSLLEDGTAARSLGSGVILDSSGILITNYHVIGTAVDIRAVLHDGRDFPAEVVGHDPDTDLAVLRIDADNLPAAVIADTRKPQTGDIVLAIGYPYGLGQAVSMGIVSAVGRSGLNLTNIEDFIQTDAAINRGSSGGALINTKGEVIGISTAILTESGGSQGIGFAIPAPLARSVMNALIEDGRVRRGWLGILPDAIDLETATALDLPPNTGILVKAIAPHTPAKEAGFEVGDIIVKVGDSIVGNQYQALKAVASQPPGSMVNIQILRNSEPMILQVRVAERPQNSKQ